MKQPYPKLRVPQWPLSSSAEAIIGDSGVARSYNSEHPARSLCIPLRSEEKYEALYLSLRVFFFEDGQFSLEMCLSDIYRASLREAQVLIKLLEQTQKRLDKALEGKPGYIHLDQFGDVLLQAMQGLGIQTVVEYHGIGQPDVVRPLSFSDINRYVTVATRIVNSIQRKAA